MTKKTADAKQLQLVRGHGQRGLRRLPPGKELCLWIGTDEGITRILRHGQRTHLTLADGLAQFSIRDLFEDRMHDLWIGTDKILSHGHNGHNTGRCRGVAARS